MATVSFLQLCPAGAAAKLYLVAGVGVAEAPAAGGSGLVP